MILCDLGRVINANALGRLSNGHTVLLDHVQVKFLLRFDTWHLYIFFDVLDCVVHFEFLLEFC